MSDRLVDDGSAVVVVPVPVSFSSAGIAGAAVVDSFIVFRLIVALLVVKSVTFTSKS